MGVSTKNSIQKKLYCKQAFNLTPSGSPTWLPKKDKRGARNERSCLENETQSLGITEK